MAKEKLDSKSVGLKLALAVQKGVLRAVPIETLKGKKPLLFVCPGKTDKQNLVQEIEKKLRNKFSKEEILTALPASGLVICK